MIEDFIILVGLERQLYLWRNGRVGWEEDAGVVCVILILDLGAILE